MERIVFNNIGLEDNSSGVRSASLQVDLLDDSKTRTNLQTA